MKHMKDRVGNFFFFFDFAGHGRMVQKYLVWLLFEDSSLLYMCWFSVETTCIYMHMSNKHSVH